MQEVEEGQRVKVSLTRPDGRLRGHFPADLLNYDGKVGYVTDSDPTKSAGSGELSNRQYCEVLISHEGHRIVLRKVFLSPAPGGHSVM